MAGVVPGLILTALYLGTVFVLVRFSSNYHPSEEKLPWSVRLRLLYKVWGVLIVVIVVVGGIYLGFFTATEAAAIGVASMAVLAIVTRRVTIKGWTSSLLEAGKITSMIFAIVVGATIFGYFLTLSQFPFQLAKTIGSLEVSPLIVVVAIMVTYLILGCFLDVLAMILLTVPIFIPVVDSLGIDFIWFGVLICIICEAALITPPVGMNCYVISGIASDVPLERIFLGVFPFLAMMVITLGLVIVFPQLALFLPGRMF
jgi:tripartite ATP-independent transporter DctM subunit